MKRKIELNLVMAFRSDAKLILTFRRKSTGEYGHIAVLSCKSKDENHFNSRKEMNQIRTEHQFVTPEVDEDWELDMNLSHVEFGFFDRRDYTWAIGSPFRTDQLRDMVSTTEA